MTKDIWINLPVKDVKRSREFFTRLGFELNPRHTGDSMACLLVGEKKVVVMLIAEPMFAGFSKVKVTDTGQSAEVLISIDAESRQEVDELARKAKDAGGTVYAEPGESQGWMYGCGFADPDGHRWNALYMDHSKMPKP
jgi:predicted lactoylglutathione lyase